MNLFLLIYLVSVIIMFFVGSFHTYNDWKKFGYIDGENIFMFLAMVFVPFMNTLALAILTGAAIGDWYDSFKDKKFFVKKDTE